MRWTRSRLDNGDRREDIPRRMVFGVRGVLTGRCKTLSAKSFRDWFFGPRRSVFDNTTPGQWDGWPWYTLLIVLILVGLWLLGPSET